MASPAVVALNGFLGDRAGLDVTDMVNPRALSAGRDFYLTRWHKPGRGGAGPIAKHHFVRWCVRQVNGGSSLVMIGKSYGAHWCLDAIDDLHIGRHVQALVFDPTCALRRSHRFKRELAHPDGITVVRQLGRRSGYQVAGANDTVIDATHSNIERTEKGRCILDAWLTKQGL